MSETYMVGALNLLELCKRCNSRSEFMMLLVVIAETAHASPAEISNERFIEATGTNHWTVHTALRSLQAKGFIRRSGRAQHSCYALAFEFEESTT
jgi:DNA-binding IclR family transcriptional regulator